MPHTKSAKKRQKQNLERRLRNRAVISDLRTNVKKLLRAVKDGNADEAKSQLSVVYKKLDKCAMRRYLHPNTAYRYKSRLTKKVNGMQTAASE
jgi:small subunit ribosomal protein S20